MSAPARPHVPHPQRAAEIASDAAETAAAAPSKQPKRLAPEQLTGAQSVIRSLEELDVEV
ncbi:MAG: acetolactate synthase large subunit, partial [Mycobacterium sp.]|nr:acetolactate synthase large subunit [Mycobacterium sp.]